MKGFELVYSTTKGHKEQKIVKEPIKHSPAFLEYLEIIKRIKLNENTIK